MKLAIIGTRGIPASYSGFETSVEETAIRFAKMNIDTSVYCRKNHYDNHPSTYKGVKLVHLPSIQTIYLDTISHTFLSVIHAAKIKYDNIIIYGVGNAVFIPIIKLFIKNVIIVLDGADWERKKWNTFAKKYLIMNRYIATKYSDYYIVDNKELLTDYQERYGGNGFYISYGAREITTYNPDILSRYRLSKDKYIIFIGRFVKEKNLEFLIKNFRLLDTNIKLLLIGGNDIDAQYEKKIKSLECENIIIPGFIYGEEYESLLYGALFYVSCSLLEGTSPSLLSAMSINGFSIVTDLNENIETLKDSCITYKKNDSLDFREKTQYFIDNPDKVENQRRVTKRVIEKYYNWDKIVKQYCSLFL